MKIFLLSVGVSLCLFSCQSSQQQSTSTDSTAASATDTSTVSGKDTSPVSLFDGQTLKGWHTYGKDSVGPAWDIDSGAIHLNAASKKGYRTRGGGDIITDDEYGNFDFSCDWKISKAGNSGLIFYVHEDTTQYKETWNTGPEMQVLDNAGHPDAKIPKHRAGDLYDLIACSQETVKPWGQWNHAEIRCVDGKLDLFLNGVNVVSTTLWDDNWKKLVAGSKFKDMPGFGTFHTGHIALQDHGNEVWFKNIMIKKL